MGSACTCWYLYSIFYGDIFYAGDDVVLLSADVFRRMSIESLHVLMGGY